MAGSARPTSIAGRTARGSMPARRDFYTFNSSIAGIEEADALLIIGSNPRREAPVLNARIRKRRWPGLPVGVIGPHADLTYHAEWLGDGPAAIAALPEAFATLLAEAKRPMVIVGQAALARPRTARRCSRRRGSWPASIGALTAEWHGFNVLHTAAARVGALDLGFLPGPWRQDAGRDDGRRGGPAVAAGRRRVRHQPHRRRHLRRLPGPPRRPRRGPGGRDPAGQHLRGKARHLREHRGPGAARRQGRVRAGRREGGLGDPARLLRPSTSRCRTTRWRRCGPGWSRSTRCSAASASCRASAPTTCRRPAAIRRPSATRRLRARLRRLLPDQPDQPRQRRDGRVQPTYAPVPAMAAE